MLTHITSADNAKVKLVKKLKSRKGRLEESAFVAEGLNLVSELICGDNETDIDFVMISNSFIERHGERAQSILDYANSERSACCEVDSSLFSKLTDAEHGVDVLAVVRYTHRDISYVDNLAADSCILVCDRIQDPGNMGTMIRTAVAAGYSGVVIMPGSVDVYSPKVLRSTAGMVFEIPIVHAASEDELFEMARRSGRRIAVTVPTGGISYYDADLHSGIALVIGNESRGVSDGISNKADLKVTLPMRGEVESLNAAVAAAILMYEAVRE